MKLACCSAYVLLTLACARTPLPCAGAGTCPSGQECLASRCVLEGGAPVESATQRMLLWPKAIAIASSAEDPHGLAPSVTLGQSPSAPTALYVRFEPSYRTPRKVHAAFLLLDPHAGAPGADEITLEVWRARRDVTREHVSWSQQPGFAPPFARGLSRFAPATPLRVDVTELLRFFTEHPALDHGFVVRAAEGQGSLTLATGVDGGLPPRLDVYLE
ncbi:MAG: hypothetical protein QM756_01010 [Polyangiaceae bacterium]